ncbi:hypothetical protein [Spongiibacter sp. IMCC21906]|nr:hypothetical protein [Spongiibacter sp. IMCC21906]
MKKELKNQVDGSDMPIFGVCFLTSRYKKARHVPGLGIQRD